MAKRKPLNIFITFLREPFGKTKTSEQISGFHDNPCAKLKTRAVLVIQGCPLGLYYSS